MKSHNFIRANPHLPVKNLQQTLDYYRDTLGFVDEWTMEDKNGYLRDGGIRRDDMRLLFGEDEALTNDINNKNHCLSVLWFVNDIDEIFLEFQELGIPIAAALTTHAYGLREFAFIDINGYYIRIAEAYTGA